MTKEEKKLREKQLLEKYEVNEMPKGWKVTEGTTTQPVGYVWINNGKSFFSGKQKSALLKEELVK